MTGTTAQPSHEPPHQRKGTGTRHTEKTSVEKNPTSLGGGRERKKMADRTQHKGKTECAKESHDRCSQPPGMHMPKTADLGTQALLVVNSFKLHLNALNMKNSNPKMAKSTWTSTDCTFSFCLNKTKHQLNLENDRKLSVSSSLASWKRGHVTQLNQLFMGCKFQSAREIIRIWTKRAWNYSLISLVTIWLHILIITSIVNYLRIAPSGEITIKFLYCII